MIDFEKCVELAQQRLRDVITAANKADREEMLSLMVTSMLNEIPDWLLTSMNSQLRNLYNQIILQQIGIVFSGLCQIETYQMMSLNLCKIYYLVNLPFYIGNLAHTQVINFIV